MSSLKHGVEIHPYASCLCMHAAAFARAIGRLGDLAARGGRGMGYVIICASLASALNGCSRLQTGKETRIAADEDVYLHKTHGKKTSRSYRVKGKKYHPMGSSKGYREVGLASWYGSESGSRTATGDHFNPHGLTAAHKTLPLPTRARVTNLENGQSTIVLVNDRGPFVPGRLIDLSYGAAKRLNMHRRGTSRVLVEALN